jgi:16S rRNA processing protein RimM
VSTGGSFEDLVTIGRIVRPQGRRGEVLTEPLTDHPTRFPELKRAFVPGPDGGCRSVVIEDCWPHKGRFVLKLEGVDTIEEAERYRGLELRIEESELPDLPEGSYYHHQLRGLAVEDGSGRAVGTVSQVMETGGVPVLVVEGDEGEALIPLAEPFLRRVDLEAGRLVAEIPRPDASPAPDRAHLKRAGV